MKLTFRKKEDGSFSYQLIMANNKLDIIKCFPLYMS